jgi:hypothetical protein
VTAFGLGWMPDAPDDRDYDAAGVLGAALAQGETPIVGSVLDQLGRPLQQGSLPSCVAQAVAKLLFAAHKRKGAVDPPLASRMAIWFLARATHGMQRYATGTHLRSAFLALNRFGFCPESKHPYDANLYATLPSTSALRASIDQARPTSYMRIFEEGEARIAAVRRAILAGFPVAFGTLVSDAFVAGRPGAVWDPPRGGGIAGGHAMIVAGYDQDDFVVLNSWGEGWGDRGLCRLSSEYVAWDETRDLWVVPDAQLYSEV